MAVGERQQPVGPGSRSQAAAGAAQAAFRFDRQLVSLPAGLLAALPVAAALGSGIAAGAPVPGITIAAGAMLVGIAWRISGGRPPLAMMATDAVGMSLSTFVGCVTGTTLWLHLLLLSLWSLLGGLLVATGNRGGAVGTQAVLAFVVFGRFPEPLPSALGLAGLVLAGGLAQVLTQALAPWPSPLRSKRAVVATAYRRLATLAAEGPRGSTLAAGTALDEAERALAAPLFGDPALLTLRSLVNEGYRVRVEVSAIHSLLLTRPGAPRTGSDADEQLRASAQALLRQAGELLEVLADASEGDRGALAALPARVQELSSQIDSLASPPLPAPRNRLLLRRLAALGGQLRAIARLVPAAAVGGGLRSRRPLPRTGRPLRRLRADAALVRANASRHSPAARHAVRLAVLVPAVALLARHLPLERNYWVVVAAATIIRPEFGTTFTRGTERALGTCAGVALAGVIAATVHPAGAAVVVLVGLLAVCAFATFPASFGVGFAFITALVVFLLEVITRDTLATAGARLLDTLLGGAIGLIAYLLWPTWSRGPARAALADLIAAERAYVTAVLDSLIAGRRVEESTVRPLARAARLARTSAEASVARSLAEPRERQIDADQSQAALSTMRRLVQATHVVRLEAQERSARGGPRPVLRGFRDALAEGLERLEASLREGRPGGVGGGWRSVEPPPDPAPDLRGAFSTAAAELSNREEDLALLAELDEIVDAANGLAAALGRA
jgi:uncharacterized membrane protein YccC